MMKCYFPEHKYDRPLKKGSKKLRSILSFISNHKSVYMLELKINKLLLAFTSKPNDGKNNGII